MFQEKALGRFIEEGTSKSAEGSKLQSKRENDECQKGSSSLYESGKLNYTNSMNATILHSILFFLGENQGLYTTSPRKGPDSEGKEDCQGNPILLAASRKSRESSAEAEGKKNYPNAIGGQRMDLYVTL